MDSFCPKQKRIGEKSSADPFPTSPIRIDQSPGEKTENANQIHRGKATAWLPTAALRPTILIGLSIGHGDTRAVDEPNMTTVPKPATGKIGFHARGQMGVDPFQCRHRELGSRLVIRAGIATPGRGQPMNSDSSGRGLPMNSDSRVRKRVLRKATNNRWCGPKSMDSFCPKQKQIGEKSSADPFPRCATPASRK